MTEGPPGPTGPPVVLNKAPAPAVSPAGTVTLVEGGTFCLSDSSGDIQPGTSHGLFFRDARLVCRWELRVDGQRPEPLSVLPEEAFGARFVLRLPPRPWRADSTLLIIRERLVGEGMRETVTVRNLGAEATAFSLVLHVDGDFADLFAVKEGRPARGGSDMTASGSELHLQARADGGRSLTITATAGPVAVPGALTWRVVIPARDSWSAEILAQPSVADRRVEPEFGHGQMPETSRPARKIQAWRSASTVITTGNSAVSQTLRRAEADLGALQMNDADQGTGPFTAAGVPWFMTLFGRDSLLTAMMALPLDVSLAVGTLRSLARVQGRRTDPFTEEEPGRIIHELRRGPGSSAVLGGSHYYGTADATPLFVMLLGECLRWGAPGSVIRELLPAADAAVSWIGRYGDRDGDGFVEYQRATDRGLANQGWKDSWDGISDAAGQLPSPPIALCEVQGYVYAALLARAELATWSADPQLASQLRAQAARLRERFAEAFWLPDRGWYAVALDRDKRPVDALASNVAHCLWTGIATDEHASAVIGHLASPDMDSGFGLRTLSAAMGAYNPMSYHNGSVWPHDTAIAVAGLMRYAHLPGAASLAGRLADGLLDAAENFGGRLPELYCGFPRDEFTTPVPYPTSCSPQAWASAAPLLLTRAFLGLDPDCPNRTLTLRPAIPPRWGSLTLDHFSLDGLTLRISAETHHARVEGLPADWQELRG
jgi:glycogen debranching enzyme